MNNLELVKEHLARLTVAGAAISDPVQGLRQTMDTYSHTGVARPPLTCRCEVSNLVGIAGEWFIPPDADLSRRNLYIHGGGWASGSVDSHRHLIDAIAVASRRPTFAVNYRLAPENKFPAGLDDCAAALAALFECGPSGKLRVHDVAVIGDSAGGNLTATVVIQSLIAGTEIPTALILLSPVTDAQPLGVVVKGSNDPIVSDLGLAGCTAMYITTDQAAHDACVSPLNAAPDLLKRFPRTLIQVGSDEYLRDQGVAFARALWENDVSVQLSVWPNMPHVFQLFPQELASARYAIREMGEFLESDKK